MFYQVVYFDEGFSSYFIL